MKIMLLGGTGFIGTNLIRVLTADLDNSITAVGRNKDRIMELNEMKLPNLHLVLSNLAEETDYEKMVEGQDVIYHLLSTTVPSTSNRKIADELQDDILFSVKLFEACVHQQVKKIIFLSSGGTVYGKEEICPLNENTLTNPITSYGIQKITIEKLLYLYNYIHGIDYRIVRLANPYGPYQQPNGVQGAVTTFIYKALKGEEIQVFGDGSIIRDFIYVDDAVKGIVKIANGCSPHHIFNLGCGHGTSIIQVIEAIKQTLNVTPQVKFANARKVDVPVNYLDISRYETAYGPLNPVSLEEGIRKTADFLRKKYMLQN